MLDNSLVDGAKDEGERPTVQSLRNRLRNEYEAGSGKEQSPKKSWLKRNNKPSKNQPVPSSEKATVQAPEAPIPQASSKAALSSAPKASTTKNTVPASQDGNTQQAKPEKRSWRKKRRTPKGKSRVSGPFSKITDEVRASSRYGNLGSFLEIFKEGLRLPTPIIVASVVSSFLGLALPLAVLQIYDRILPNQSIETLTLLTLGLFAAFALDAILKVLRSYLLGWNAVRSGFDAQLTAVTRLLKAPHAQVEKEPPGIWVDGLEAVRELSAFEGGQSRLLTLDIPLAGIFLIVLGLVGGPLIVVPILLIALFGTMGAFHGKRLQKTLTDRADQDNRKHDFLVESLSGIHTLKGLAMEPMILRRFERLQKGSAIASYETILLGNKLQSMGIMFANMMMISVVSVGALFVMAGELSIGGLACCSLLSGRLTQPVLRGIGMWTEFQNIQLAQERAGKFGKLEADNSAKHEPDLLTGSIELRDLGFEYPGVKRRSCLENVSLKVLPGEFVGIKGEDGSGRSTLVKLITGELKPTSGSVIIGGLESCPDREQSQLQEVAYVSANTATFKGTILENITMFRTGAAVEVAQQAAKLIGLEEEIHRLPEGYDTPLAQGVAKTLSAGMMQRISIARALARNPKILIFDEANSMLDFQSDVALRKGLESLKGKMTAIIISNRPSFLSISDRSYALQDNTLVDLTKASPPTSTQVPMQGSAA